MPLPTRRTLAAGAVLCALAGAPFAPTREDKKKGVQPADLRRGLVASYGGGVERLEPTVALALKAGEAPDPRLGAGGGKVVWRGYLNVLRGGSYTFSARVRGEFLLKVGGKEVLTAAEKGDAALKTGPAVKLEAGVQALEATYSRPAGAARVELFWQGPSIRTEPLPHDAVGHTAAQETPALKAGRLVDDGRLLAEEASCVRCHKPSAKDEMAKGLATRQGPDLSQVGARAHAGWLERWLESPRALRPGTLMPEMFAAGEAGRAERYAVAAYLASLGGPVPDPVKKPNPRAVADAAGRGERLFHTLGCVACHGPVEGATTTKPTKKKDEDDTPPPVLYPPAAVHPLIGLGSKTTPAKLAAFLRDPLAVHPGGRMPNMLLQAKEAEDLAYFLCRATVEKLGPDLPSAPPEKQMLEAFRRLEGKAEAVKAFAALPAAERWRDLGQRLVVAKGCANCHTVAPGGKALTAAPAKAALDDVRKPARHGAGCLAPEPAADGKAPAFGFTKGQREALAAFLGKGLTGAGSPAPAYAARLDLQRFNCLACHTRDGEGGLSGPVVQQLRRYEKAENAEDVVPPTLTGVGHKLRTPWLREVLTGGGRARPWVGLRMPQFGPANVGKLPEALAALEGAEPDATVHKVAATASKIGVGRQLVGKGAFGCISCHDLGGIASGGTRGPDLAGMTKRVRYDWYLRWLEQPQRMSPGTRMPSVFSDGKSILDKVLGGKADAQAEAMWAYLSLGPGLPMPPGMEPTKGLVVSVDDRPVLLRTFLPGLDPRSIAVGFPGGTSAAFDARSARLAYAWSGGFLDAAPAWLGRGGQPAKPLGTPFWQAPPGCPVGAGTAADPPDFAARAANPAYGGPVAEGKLYAGPALLRFGGYATDKDGAPTFRYHLGGEKSTIEVEERVTALRSPVALGVARRFGVKAPAKHAVWLLAAQGAREPRVYDAEGAAVKVDLKKGKADVPAAGRVVFLPQDGDRVVALALADPPAGCAWRLQKAGAAWQVLAQAPPTKAGGKVVLDLRVWAPYRDEPGLAKELAGK